MGEWYTIMVMEGQWCQWLPAIFLEWTLDSIGYLFNIRYLTL